MINRELLPYVVAGTLAVSSILEAVIIHQQITLLNIKDQQIANLQQLYNGEIRLYSGEIQFTNNVLQQNLNLLRENLELRKAR